MNPTPAHALLVGARSDIGPRRPSNQDSGYASGQLLLIADGVGGGPAGDIASTLIVRSLSELLVAPGALSERVLRDCVALANARIARAGRQVPRLRGMATTMSGLVLGAERSYLVHVGDSRAYRWRGGELRQMTTDQSWLQLLLDEGACTPEEAKHHPMRNMLLHSLSGSVADAEAVHITPIDLRIGDRWLLATDGLTSYLPTDEFAALTDEVGDPQELADELVRQAWPRSRDNISVVVGDVGFSTECEPGRFIGAAAGLPDSAERAV